ncbi:hypothetical protein SGLAD_v1c06460 [Spiroplasma gladiatoris]|uniref:RDD domain-containing protein n=1 Tax=Spiroplasma gladiatoris TaxID=2143 RepID=A0A4P7AHC5_9MOLU|nr:hypothetical protein [Spiroplasma gladiatoris]QBQ07845.1 hypothetical protein SGLAD_v1c06460 [Spiroplasma gladiatoris]
MKAGYWRRFGSNFIDTLLFYLTFGIYFIIYIVFFCQGKKSVGMEATKIKYSNPDAMGALYGFSILANIFYILIIPLIIDFFKVILREGTFAERWSQNFLIEEERNVNFNKYK